MLLQNYNHVNYSQHISKDTVYKFRHYSLDLLSFSGNNVINSIVNKANIYSLVLLMTKKKSFLDF